MMKPFKHSTYASSQARKQTLLLSSTSNCILGHSAFEELLCISMLFHVIHSTSLPPVACLIVCWLLVFTLRKCFPKSYTDTSLVIAFRKCHRCLSVHTLTHTCSFCVFPADVWAFHHHLLFFFPLLVPRPMKRKARCFESLRSFYGFVNCFLFFLTFGSRFTGL